jgi:hypothetical protein
MALWSTLFPGLQNDYRFENLQQWLDALEGKNDRAQARQLAYLRAENALLQAMAVLDQETEKQLVDGHEADTTDCAVRAYIVQALTNLPALEP